MNITNHIGYIVVVSLEYLGSVRRLNMRERAQASVYSANWKAPSGFEQNL